MRRARNPTPFEMKGITYDPKDGLYTISEAGITYKLTLEHTRLLKAYFRFNLYIKASIADWYNELDRFTKKDVIRTGTSFQDDNFYLDIEQC